MTKRYNVYFSGQVIDGCDPAVVRRNLGKLFKADEATLDKLFCGKPRLVKRDCDEATAQKYRAAMERAGAQPLIESPADEAAASAADKIAALAAAPDDSRFQPSNAAESDKEQTAAAPQAPAEQSMASAAAGALDLAPPRSDVLREDERSVYQERQVDTSHLQVDESGAPLAPLSPPPPSGPDTSHLGMAEVGADIPNLPSDRAALSPDISAIDLSPEGTDFSDCAGPAASPPVLDLSGLDVAPEGSELVPDTFRKHDNTPAPATDHITLEN